MFDIPMEAVILWFGSSFVFVAIGLLSEKQYLGTLIVIGGVLIFTFVALTDNIIMGYHTDTNTTYDNVTRTIHEDSIEEPDLYPLEEMSKAMFGLMGASFMAVGSIVFMRRS